MYTFLFDILPETGHVRITLELAILLSDKGHEVYYTDSSDSVFTSGLLGKGIGRIFYPDDLQVFTPDLVLLDIQLRTKAGFYRKRQVRFVYLTPQLGEDTFTADRPVISLPPSESSFPLSSARMEHLLASIPALREEPSRVLIVGLLEETGRSADIHRLYEVVKKCCIANKHYQLVLLVHDPESVKDLFPIPDNMSIYRLLDLPALLPLCDVALTSGDLNSLIEGIYAGLPSLTYPDSRHAEHQANARRSVHAGLGLYGEIRRTTPRMFERQIAEILSNRIRFKQKSQHLRQLFDHENKNLQQVINRLITLITTK